MGVSFCLHVVERSPDNKVRACDDPDFRCADRLRQLGGLLDPVDARGRRPLARTFPWYFKAFDWEAGRAPTAADCAQPKDVLAGIHALERELQRNPKRYAAEWRLWLRQADGTESRCQQIVGVYRGKRCRVYTDDQGAWAVEADSKMAYPIHYPLSDLPEVSVQVDADGSPVTVRIEALSLLAAHHQVLAELKRVCVLALQKNALVLPSFV